VSEYLYIHTIEMTNQERAEFQAIMMDVTLEQATAQRCVANKTFELGKTSKPQCIVKTTMRSLTQIW